MKKSILHFTLLAIVIGLLCSCGEAQREDRICANTCEDETVIEIIKQVEGKIIQIGNNPWTIETHPDFINKQGYSPSNEFTLVPCNLSENDKVNERIVIVSGKKLSCCNLLTLPQLRTSWGCKFEITSIKSLEIHEN